MQRGFKWAATHAFEIYIIAVVTAWALWSIVRPTTAWIPAALVLIPIPSYFAIRLWLARKSLTSAGAESLTLKDVSSLVLFFVYFGALLLVVTQEIHPWLPASVAHLGRYTLGFAVVLGVAASFLDRRSEKRMRELAERRTALGQCTGCGYSRRGLSPDAKCPECGTVSS